mgnify:CR=1 FL=1
MKLIKFFILNLCLLVITQTQAIEVIDILGGKANELSVAVTPFVGDETNNIHNVIKSDLTRSGFFRAINIDAVKSFPKNIEDVDFTFWSALKTELLIIGKVEDNGDQIKVTYDLVDVFKEKLMTTLEFIGKKNQDRQIAHQISNLVYEKITGTPGVFHTKVAFVKKIDNKKFTLNVSDMDGYNSKAVVTSTQPIISTRWSPDGEKIAYVSFEKKKPVIFVQNLKTGERKLVANFKGNNSAPAWSPDSKKLAIVLTYNANSQIYLMDADGSNIKRLIRSRSIDTEPTWSPDGKSIFFVSDRGGGPQIYKMNLDDDEAKRVTFEGRYNVSPRLSPDGKLLTFITMEQGSFRVAVQNLISNQVMKLTVGRNDESPIFSPNGHMILYTKKLQGEKAEIATVSLNGLKSVKIDVGKELTQEPTWSPFDF